MEISDYTMQLIDLAGAADEHRPTEAEVADAPYLGEWSFSLYPGTELVCMTGFAIGHPRLGTTTVTTRPLVAVDVDAGWVRTQGRVYRLGDRR